MKSHRIIWRVTALAVAIAAVVLFLTMGRDAWLRPALQDPEIDDRDRRVARMLTLLDQDPRSRRPDTRDAILSVVDLATDPALDSAEIHYALGLFHHSYGRERFPEAEAEFRRAIELRPGWSHAHNRLAIVLYETGQREEAAEAWQTATALAPGWSRPYNDQAILYRRSGDFDAALAAVAQALRLDPQSAEPVFITGVIFDTTGNRNAARICYELAIERDPGQAPPWFNIACAFGREGRLYPAVFHLRMAIERNPRFFIDAFLDPDLAPLRTRADYYRLLTLPYNEWDGP